MIHQIGTEGIKEVALFIKLSKEKRPQKTFQKCLSMSWCLPSCSQRSKRPLLLGFWLFIPFLVIDMVVAASLMSMGMIMLPPVMISLPFKIILFVLVDGWSILSYEIVRSYNL